MTVIGEYFPLIASLSGSVKPAKCGQLVPREQNTGRVLADGDWIVRSRGNFKQVFSFKSVIVYLQKIFWEKNQLLSKKFVTLRDKVDAKR